MKTQILIALLLLGSLPTIAQPEPGSRYRNFPIIITLQFHALSLPFKDLRANFQNVGIGIGTEVSYNSKNNWVQQVSLAWYANRAIGNGLLLYSQAVWRPGASPGLFGEVKAGAGYLYAFRPNAYEQVNGEWKAAGHKGKGMLAVPVGVSLGYDAYTRNAYASPFITYQFMLVKGYNDSVPFVPQTLVQAGVRIHRGE
jgi:hypothetical protein